jgi:hypothetical protein
MADEAPRIYIYIYIYIISQMKVSKEVAKQRQLESGLLSGYQRLLQLLESRRAMI